MNETETTFFYRQSSLPAPVRDEIALIGAIVIQFEQMDAAAQRRILGYLNSRYGEARP